MSDDIKRKEFTTEVRAAGDGTRQVTFVITTGSRDRDNDTIAADGWDLEAYRRNPTVLWAHSSKDLPVAKCVSIRPSQDGLVAVAEFAPPSIHPFAEQVFQLLKGGYLNATSVGFRAKKWDARGDGIDFLEQELLEFSIVPVPANAEALMVRGADTRGVKAWLAKSNEPVLDLVDDDEPTLDADDALVSYALELETRQRLRGRAGNAAQRAGLLPEERFDVDPKMLAELVSDGVARGVAELLNDEIRRAFNRVRGRID